MIYHDLFNVLHYYLLMYLKASKINVLRIYEIDPAHFFQLQD